MVKTGSSRADKYAVKYDGRIMALRVKHWNTRAKTNAQNPQFDLSLIASNLQEFFDTLSLKYGERGNVTHLFNMLIQVYPTINAPLLESFHQRWLSYGLSEAQWALLILEIENKLVEIGHYFYRSSVRASAVRTMVTVSGVAMIQNYLIIRRPTPLEYGSDMVKGDMQILSVPSPPHQTEENSGIKTHVVSNDIIDIVSPLLNLPIAEFTVTGISPLLAAPVCAMLESEDESPTFEDSAATSHTPHALSPSIGISVVKT